MAGCDAGVRKTYVVMLYFIINNANSDISDLSHLLPSLLNRWYMFYVARAAH